MEESRGQLNLVHLILKAFDRKLFVLRKYTIRMEANNGKSGRV